MSSKSSVTATHTCDRCKKEEQTTHTRTPSWWVAVYTSGRAFDFCTASCAVAHLAEHKEAIDAEGKETREIGIHIMKAAAKAYAQENATCT